MLNLRLADGSDPYLNVLHFQESGIPVLIFSALESPYLIRRALQAGAAAGVDNLADSTAWVNAQISAALHPEWAESVRRWNVALLELRLHDSIRPPLPG